MDAREIHIKGIISMIRTEYSLLNEVLKFHECGWSKGVFGTALLPFFQLRSSSTVPNTSNSTNSAPRKTWS
jgi:hypothetical protein